VDLPDVGEDRDDDGRGDQEPEELVVLRPSDVERERETAEALRAPGQVRLGRREDRDDRREPERADEDAVGVEIGDEPPDEDAGEPGDDRRRGGAHEELPRLAERPVHLDVEDAEDVHPEAEEPRDAKLAMRTSPSWRCRRRRGR